MESQELKAPLFDPIEIVQAKIAVMKECGNVEKNGWNDFHKYKFATDEDVLRLVQPLLAKHGLILNMWVDRVEYDDGKNPQVFFNMQWIHESGKAGPVIPWIGIAGDRDRSKNLGDKWFNKAATAAEKYFLLKQFHIPAGEDADADKTPEGAPNTGDRGTNDNRRNSQARRNDQRPPEPEAPRLDPSKPQKVEAGKSAEDLRRWVGPFAAVVKAAPSLEALGRWIDINADTINDLREVAPNLANRLEATRKARAELLEAHEREQSSEQEQQKEPAE